MKKPNKNPDTKNQRIIARIVRVMINNGPMSSHEIKHALFNQKTKMGGTYKVQPTMNQLTNLLYSYAPFVRTGIGVHASVAGASTTYRPALWKIEEELVI